jgi:hypothetical protein
MNDEPTSFECGWCKDAEPDDPEFYLYPMDMLGGHCIDTGRCICENCADAATMEEVTRLEHSP